MSFFLSLHWLFWCIFCSVFPLIVLFSFSPLIVLMYLFFFLCIDCFDAYFVLSFHWLFWCIFFSFSLLIVLMRLLFFLSIDCSDVSFFFLAVYCSDVSFFLSLHWLFWCIFCSFFPLIVLIPEGMLVKESRLITQMLQAISKHVVFFFRTCIPSCSFCMGSSAFICK